MRSIVCLGLACCSMVAGMASAQDGDQDAKALVDRAIKAMGGADKINKYPAALIKAKGKVTVMNNELPFTGEFAFQFPDKVRNTVEVEANGMKITNTQVYDGKKAWISVLNETKELKDAKQLTEYKEAVHAQRVAGLYKLDKDFSFAAVGEVKINDKPAQGVRVSFKGRRDVNLYFDKDKGHIVKAEFRALDPITMKEVRREDYLSGYKAVDGIQVPHKLIVDHDGERFLEIEITEARHLERHDDNMFAKP